MLRHPAPGERGDHGVVGDSIRLRAQTANAVEDERGGTEVAGAAVGVDEGVEVDNVRADGERGHEGGEEVVGRGGVVELGEEGDEGVAGGEVGDEAAGGEAGEEVEGEVAEVRLDEEVEVEVEGDGGWEFRLG